MAEEFNLDAIVERTVSAQAEYAKFSQEQVDALLQSVSLRLLEHRVPLAREAVDETRMGNFEDKVIKNHSAVESVCDHYRDVKSCGIISENRVGGEMKIAEPVGVVCGIIPCTNPSATAIFYMLLCIKARNGIVFSAHPRSKGTTNHTIQIAREALADAGAPEDLFTFIPAPTVPLTKSLMGHVKIDLILATGGDSMVMAANLSGNPTVCAGAGNVPVMIHDTADIKRAVSDIFVSKMFDNGLACTSEQCIMAYGDAFELLKSEFIERGGYIASDDEADRLREAIRGGDDGIVNRAIIGQPATVIARIADIDLPPGTVMLGAEIDHIAMDEPLSWEKLSPIVALMSTESADDALAKSLEIIKQGGAGHSAAIHANEGTKSGAQFLHDAQLSLPTTHIIINAPTTSAVVGKSYNFSTPPTFMKCCGSWGGASVCGNVTLDALMNIKTVISRREDMAWFRVPPKIYFHNDSLRMALQDIKGRRRAVVITDASLVKLGYARQVTDALHAVGLDVHVFSSVEPDPSFETITRGVEFLNLHNPDTIVAFGGGSPMDAAKIMRLLYECPDVDLHSTVLRFLNVRRRVYKFPDLSKAKSILICIPTTSGTGSEVTPFAVVTDPKDHRKYPIGDYELTPQMAIIDPQFVATIPKMLAAHTGMDALSHAIESYTSAASHEFVVGISVEAARLLLKYLPLSCSDDGSKRAKAREKCHYAATMASMSVAQVLVGVAHSMAHALGGIFGLPHGLAIALMLPVVMRFNASVRPMRQSASAVYKHSSKTRKRYARLSMYAGLCTTSDSTDRRIDALIERVEEVKQLCGLPRTIGEAGVDRAEFDAKMDDLCIFAYDDQCSLSNPRLPQLNEIRGMLIEAYTGEVDPKSPSSP